MCDYGMAISTAMGLAGDISQYKADKADWKAIVAAKKEEARNVVRATNYDLQDLEINRQDNFEAAIAEIEKIRQNSLGLTSSVEASVAEEMGEGRTADLIVRAAKGDEARTVASVKDNYGRVSNEIDLNKERTVLDANQVLSGIKTPAKPSKTALAFKMAGTVWGNYQDYANRRTQAKADGLDYGFGGATQKNNVNLPARRAKGGRR